LGSSAVAQPLAPRLIKQRALELAQSHSDFVQVRPLAPASAAPQQWLITLSAQTDPHQQPAVCVVGGIDSRLAYTPELVLRLAETMAEQAAKDDSARKLLRRTTFYLIPTLAADAYARQFDQPYWPSPLSRRRMDLDNDGRYDEDPPEDLNGDGRITRMRVKDPAGEWKPLEGMPQIMVKADPARGEQGSYRLLWEGQDNDQDGQYNEDPRGGVNPNANFPFNYSRQQQGAGPFPMADSAARNVADFLYERFNVYAVLGFGPQDNLSHPWSYKSLKRQGKMPSGQVKEGHKVSYKLLNQLYQASGLKKLPAVLTDEEQSEGGHFLQWSYLHYGRLTLSTPAWAPQPAQDTSDTSDTSDTNDTSDTSGAGLPKAHRDDPRVRFAQWARQNGRDSALLAWQTYKHPDFPYRPVELGGIAPGARFRPPDTALAQLADQYQALLTRVAQAMPRPAFNNLKVYKLQENLYRLELDLHNAGQLPTVPAVAADNKWMKLQTLRLKTSGQQTLVAGSDWQTLEPLRAGKRKTFRWLIRGKGKVSLRAGAPQTGYLERSIALN
jgi:hypothetical protein